MHTEVPRRGSVMVSRSVSVSLSVVSVRVAVSVMAVLARARTVRIRLWHDCLHFRHGNHGEVAAEQEEERKEEAERADHRSNVDPRWREHVPRAWEEVVGQARDDDHKALEPHADVHKDREHEHERDAGADLLEPEELRRDHVAADHDPVRPPVLTERAVDERELLVHRARVPRDEELHRVRVADHATGHEDDLVHVVEVAQRDEVLETEEFTRRNRERDHHREAGEDCASDEVRREDRGVPTGQLRGREVERNDRVHRENERRRERSKDEVGALVAVPVAVRAAPTEAEEAVTELLDLALRAIAQGCKVRHHARVPEEERHGEVGRNCEHVPEERRAELRPHFHLVRDREEPVRKPHATNVDARERTCADDCEDRHRFGEAVDARAPLLTEQEEDRADERACVTDADPEHEVRDVVGPHDGVVETPHANTREDEVADARAEDAQESERGRECDVPSKRRLLGFVHAADRRGDFAELVHVEDKRRAFTGTVDGVVGHASERMIL